jgi:hypothetical protein
MKAGIKILQSARIVELRSAVMETAELCKDRSQISLPKSSKYRSLKSLLVRERKRNAKLVKLVHHG